MCDKRHSALLTVIVPMVVAEIVRAYGLDEKIATEQFYASRVYDELSDEGKKLWHYSPKVLFSMYDEEKRTGAITYPEEAF
jgi:hypothetical protein